jgi:hypothetical protein
MPTKKKQHHEPIDSNASPPATPARATAPVAKRRSAQVKALTPGSTYSPPSALGPTQLLPAAPSATPAATPPAGTTPTAPAAAGSVPAAPTATTTASPSVVVDPSTITAPIVPAGFSPTPLKRFRGVYPNAYELQAGQGAADDLDRFADYPEVLGSTAVPAGTVSSSLRRALAWHTLRMAAEQWVTWVKAEDALAWQEADANIDEVRTLFTFASSKNPALAKQYPSLTQFLEGTKLVAKQAQATRVRNAKTRAADAKSANEVSATTANAASTGATSAQQQAGATAAAPATKTVTVNT